MAADSLFDWLSDRKHRRIIPHRFEQCSYIKLRNPARGGLGMWVVRGHVQKELSVRDRLAAAQKLLRKAAAEAKANG